MTYDEPKILIRLRAAGDILPPVTVETRIFMNFERMVDKSLSYFEQKYSLRNGCRFPYNPELYASMKKR